ncbi:hypothetical protein [Listeria booriae]|uniref:hypothetical protein n=1 Tax=Listeria booriae TaxID=1552123 RepID=UPI00163D98C9|nr:hypothetical protein [Listeria booriae]MBC1307933.1 hypothetical protein [Listeria booriae]
MDISIIECKVKHLSALGSQYRELQEAALYLEQEPSKSLAITCSRSGSRPYTGRLVQDLGLDGGTANAVSSVIKAAIQTRRQEIEDYFEKYLGGMPDEQ